MKSLKRSKSLVEAFDDHYSNGHLTSISLEDDFLEALRENCEGA